MCPCLTALPCPSRSPGSGKGATSQTQQAAGAAGQACEPSAQVSTEDCVTLHSYLGRSCWAVTFQAYGGLSKGQALPSVSPAHGPLHLGSHTFEMSGSFSFPGSGKARR